MQERAGEVRSSPYCTPEHEAFRDTARRFASEEIEPFAAERDEAGEFPRELYKKAAGVGAIRSSGEVMLNYVSPDARFRGVSKAIVARLEAQACERGVDVVTFQSSATARQFYLAVGFRETGPPVEGFGITLGYPMSKRLPFVDNTEQ